MFQSIALFNWNIFKFLEIGYLFSNFDKLEGTAQKKL